MGGDISEHSVRFVDLSADSLVQHLDLTATAFVSKDSAFRQLHYLSDYVKRIGCISLAIEPDYIDRDYMEDHSVFYSKSLTCYPNTCRRVHFFRRHSAEQVRAQIVELLRASVGNGRSDYLKRCQELSEDAYLGFAVIKPLRGSPIGRTVLRSYEKQSDPGFIRQYTCLRDYNSHFAGVELSVRGLAFQQQDVGVSACATTAIWSALHKARDFEDIGITTPAQITLMASKFALPFGRAMPSEGLSLDQMCQAVEAAGASPNLFPVEHSFDNARGYLHAITKSEIASVLVLRQGENSFHAVTVTGMKIQTTHPSTPIGSHSGVEIDDQAGDLKAVYVHDDRLGPYVRGLVERDGNNLQLKLRTGYGENEFEPWLLSHILVPTHSKVRLSFQSLRKIAIELARRVAAARAALSAKLPEAKESRTVTIESWVSRAHSYLERLFVEAPGGSDELFYRACTRHKFSRYIGIARATSAFLGTVDLVIDMTSTYRNPNCILMVPIGPKKTATLPTARLLAKDFECEVLE